jgi:hypothetical protein
MRGPARIIHHPLVVLQSILLLIVMQYGIVAAAGQRLSTEASNNFLVQAGVLLAEKEALTSVQKRVNSNIIRHLHTKILRDKAETLPNLQTNIVLTDKNEILTDIKANVTDSLLETIENNGGTIINKFPQYRAIRAIIPITSVEEIAAHPDVQFIDIAAEAMTNKTNTSEGDVAHSAPTVRAQGYTGSGIKIGVLSDSVDHLAEVQATGDLPAVTVLQDAPGHTGEGTAMLEIVYDLAPAASLYFATAYDSPANFANNIIALKNAGCKVIVDDVGYFNESPFQDDVISQAVSTVTAAGVLYFSSAANSGNKNAGTAGTWEGDFVDGGSLVTSWGTIGHVHAFTSGVLGNQILSGTGAINLFWSDPLGASSNDYDLFLVDMWGNVLAASYNPQDGTQDPYEIISNSGGADLTGYYVVINKASGADRFLHMSVIRGTTQYSTNGDTKGHATVDTAFGVAAVSAHLKTTPFTGAEALETFSSDGPRRIFYNPDGSAITPGNFSSTGGRVRLKPDITAADGVACATPGFNPFYGTSAAAPHAAAIAGLLLAAKGTPSQIRNALTTTALPSATWNENAGYGIVMADRALNALPKQSILAPILMLLSN